LIGYIFKTIPIKSPVSSIFNCC